MPKFAVILTLHYSKDVLFEVDAASRTEAIAKIDDLDYLDKLFPCDSDDKGIRCIEVFGEDFEKPDRMKTTANRFVDQCYAECGKTDH
jgi:hypothetical protein